MDLLFLGTSSGTPTKARNVTALALVEEAGRAWYLIDCGEATQHQLLRTPLSLVDLQAIFVTHVHGDHCYGLPGLLGSAGMSGRKAPITIVAPTGIEAWICATLQHTQLHLPFQLVFVAAESLESWSHRNFTVAAFALSHRVPSYAYSFTETAVPTELNVAKLDALGLPRGPLWGQLKKGLDVAHNGRMVLAKDVLTTESRTRKVVIGGDNDRPDRLADACKNCDVLVHEATYTSDLADKAALFGHSYALQVATFAAAAAVPNLVLTHFSPRYQFGSSPQTLTSLRDEAARVYAGKLFLAEDLVRYRLKKSGEFGLNTGHVKLAAD